MRNPRGMLLAIVCAWLAGAGAGLAQTAPPAYAPMIRDSGIGTFHQVCVRDEKGAPVPYATVEFAHHRDQANVHGILVIERPPGMPYPLRVDIRAPGFHPATVFVDPKRENVDVFLKPDPAQPAPGPKTVSVSELSPEARAEVARLIAEAQAALEKQDLPGAEFRLRRAVEKAPSSTRIRHGLALIALHQGRVNEAAGWLEQAVALDPASPKLVGDLGMVRFLQERRQESYHLLTQAVERGYARPDARYQLGLLALGQGKWKEARNELERSNAERFPYRDLFLSQALRRLGKTAGAAKAFLRFIARRPARYLIFRWKGSAAPRPPSK